LSTTEESKINLKKDFEEKENDYNGEIANLKEDFAKLNSKHSALNNDYFNLIEKHGKLKITYDKMKVVMGLDNPTEKRDSDRK
ncbi:MAG: hypothetical protein KKE23_00185, partial [Nanoarchaeota archaeon]|nr:hypothetical protein [Nanoarchaeota archaeon]